MQEDQEDFRDAISTVDNRGKRVWIYPKKPSGKWYNYRKWMSYGLLLFLFGVPYIKIGGEPLLLFDVVHRRFSVFGQIFHAQDLYIFALAMIAIVLFITAFTVVFGRLFCGWVCPQTIFMEMVFRRIEYWIEGDWTQQKRLAKLSWTGEKIRKKLLKHTIFWFISFLIANTFLSYIIGYEELFGIIAAGPFAHLGGFTAIVVFTTIFYLVFSQFREQVCTVVCPYGRLQSVLLDRHSLVVAYDYVRGEGRAKFRKNEDRKEAGKGDCIDCSQCVHVCPTGIDIRNGTQLECVNCTACIDACDHMMESVGLEKGLIRFASVENIETRKPFSLTARAKAYIIVLVGLIGLLGFVVIGRDDVNTTILRTRGTLLQKPDSVSYSNIYDVNMKNKTAETYNIELRVIGSAGEVILIGEDLVLSPYGEVSSNFMIKLPRTDVHGRSMKVELGIFADDELIDKVKTTFIGPSI